MRRESIVAPFFWPLEKVATFEIVAGTLCHFSVVNHSCFSWSSKFFLSFLVFYFSFFQIALMHGYVTNLTTKPPFEIVKLRSFAYWSEFPSQCSWQEYPRTKNANAKSFTYERGVRVTFSRLTMRKGHLCVTFRRAISFQGSLMFSSLGTRSRDSLGTKL